MLRLRQIMTGFVAAGFLLAGALPALADGPLDLVPESASVVVKLKTPEDTISSVGAFANKAQPGIGFVIQSQAPALGVLISNPTLGGVDLSKDWHVVVFPKKETDPAVAFVIPATDASAMKEAIGQPFTFAEKGDWVAYSQDEETTKLFQACIDGSGKSITGTLEKRSAEIFSGANLAVHVNLNKIKEIFADEIAEADDELARGLEQLKNQPGQPALQSEAVQEMLKGLAKGFLQAVHDSSGFTAGVSVTDTALTIDELLVVDKDSPTDKFLGRNPTSDLALLEKLPQDQQMYFGIKGNAKGLIEFGMKMAAGVVGDNEELAAQLKKFGESMQAVELGSMAASVGLGEGESGLLKSITLTEAKPAAELRKVMREASNLKFEQPGVTQEVDIKTDAEDYDGLKADVITVKQHFDPAADPLGVAESIITLLYGEEGMVQRVVSKGDLVVQTQGGGQEHMKAALAALEQPRDSLADSAVLKARATGLAKANFVGLVDIPNLAVRGLSAALASGQFPIPIPPDALKGLKIPASFVAFSVGTEPGGLRMKTTVPAETLQGFAIMSATIRQAMQGGGGGF